MGKINVIIFFVFLILLILLIVFFNMYKYQVEKFTNKIDKIYVINLKKNTDRLEKFIEHSRKANVAVERFDAVNGKELEKDDPYILRCFIKEHNLNPGQIGCALSHIKIWEDAVKNNYNNIIVFEDDAVIPEDFWDKFDKVYNELPEDWDLLLLGGTNLGGRIYSDNLLVPDNRSGNWGTFAMLINVNFIKKILKELKLNTTIDDYLINNYYYNKKLKIFFVKKNLIKVDFSFNSDIGVIGSGKNNPIIIYDN